MGGKGGWTPVRSGKVGLGPRGGRKGLFLSGAGVSRWSFFSWSLPRAEYRPPRPTVGGARGDTPVSRGHSARQLTRGQDRGLQTTAPPRVILGRLSGRLGAGESLHDPGDEAGLRGTHQTWGGRRTEGIEKPGALEGGSFRPSCHARGNHVDPSDSGAPAACDRVLGR